MGECTTLLGRLSTEQTPTPKSTIPNASNLRGHKRWWSGSLLAQTRRTISTATSETEAIPAKKILRKGVYGDGS